MNRWSILAFSRVTAAAAALAMGCSSQAPSEAPEDEAAATEDAVVGGEASSDHRAIGVLNLPGGGYCTGTLIRSRVVLTATHCVDDKQPEGYAFAIDGAANPYPSDRAHAFGTWSADNEPGWRARDIALIRLKTAVPRSAARPVGLAPRWPERGATLSLFGYGCTDRASGANGGTKRKVELAYDEAWQSEQAGRQHLCPGDSGGPLLDKSKGVILGINSGYIRGIDYYGDVPGMYQELFDKMGEWGVPR